MRRKHNNVEEMIQTYCDDIELTPKQRNNLIKSGKKIFEISDDILGSVYLTIKHLFNQGYDEEVYKFIDNFSEDLKSIYTKNSIRDGDSLGVGLHRLVFFNHSSSKEKFASFMKDLNKAREISFFAQNYIIGKMNSLKLIDYNPNESHKEIDIIHELLKIKESEPYYTHKKIIELPNETFKEGRLLLNAIADYFNPKANYEEKKKSRELLLKKGNLLEMFDEKNNPKEFLEIMKKYQPTRTILKHMPSFDEINYAEFNSFKNTILEYISKFFDKEERFVKTIKEELDWLKEERNYTDAKIEVNNHPIHDYLTIVGDCISFSKQYEKEGLKLIKNNQTNFLSINLYNNELFRGTIGRAVLADVNYNKEKTLLVAGFSGGNLMDKIPNWESEIFQILKEITIDSNYKGMLINLNPLGQIWNNDVKHNHIFSYATAKEFGLEENIDFTFKKYWKGEDRPTIFEPTKEFKEKNTYEFKLNKKTNGLYIGSIFETKEDAINSEVTKERQEERHKPFLVKEKGFVSGIYIPIEELK